MKRHLLDVITDEEYAAWWNLLGTETDVSLSDLHHATHRLLRDLDTLRDEAREVREAMESESESEESVESFDGEAWRNELEERHRQIMTQQGSSSHPSEFLPWVMDSLKK